MFETYAMKSMHTLNPIIDWTAEDVWEYLNSRSISYCCLYDEGFDRIGCIGCPLAGPTQMWKEFAHDNTSKGATSSAVMFSLIQTTIENGLDPYNYLTWPLRKAKDADLTDAEIARCLQNAITDGRYAPME